MWYNMDEPWKHYAQWKKPVTEDHVLYMPYIWNGIAKSETRLSNWTELNIWNVQNRQVHRDRRLVIARGWRGWGTGKGLILGMGLLFEMMEML